MSCSPEVVSRIANHKSRISNFNKARPFLIASKRGMTIRVVRVVKLSSGAYKIGKNSRKSAYPKEIIEF